MHSVIVSVVISTYNRRESLEKVIKSIQIQTFSNLEILVCDDGSTDDTEEMVNRLSKKDERIRYINCGHNGRPAIPRNVGIREAKGEWIAFTDDDDYWNPTKLEAQLFMLEKYSQKACCTNAFRVVDGVNEGEKYHKQDKKVKVLGVVDFLGRNPVICSTMMVSRDLLARAGGFPEDEELKAIEDYALWIRLACMTSILSLPNTLVDYSVNSRDSIRQAGIQTFPKQKEKVLQALEKWLHYQADICKRNLRVGKRRFLVKQLEERTIFRAWETGKCVVKKVLRKS